MSGSSALGIALLQGGFNVATGVWALVDLDSGSALSLAAIEVIYVSARRRG